MSPIDHYNHALSKFGDALQARIQPRRRFAPCPAITLLTMTESLAEGLSVGHPDMPEFFFEPDDITAILAYLNSIQEQ